MEKKAKAEAKRLRRIKRKQGDDVSIPPEYSEFVKSSESPEQSEQPDVEPNTPDESN
jgi:hypothetical protein